MQSAYTSHSSKTAASTSGSLIDSLSQRLWQLGHAMVQVFAPDDSIKVRKGQRKGQTIWFVYDRYTNQHHEFTTEQEVRDWLEKP